MQTIRAMTAANTEQANAERVRHELKRFVDALGGRLGELEQLAQLARRFNVFSADEYSEFKQLFLSFRDLCDEFQTLSRLAESSLASMQIGRDEEALEMEATYRQVQVPMLRAMIRTNLRLLRVWEDRLQSGEGLPYGARELFRETVRIINTAREELLRPRYMELLEPEALDEAAEADRLLRHLISNSPQFFDFLESQAIDTELMRLINGLPN